MTRKKPPKPTGPLSSDELALWFELESLAGAESILDWVPLMSPTFQRPEHLTQLAEVLVRSQFEPIYATIAVPPRHSKTETIVHSIPWRLLRDPTCEIAYCTYEANLAYSKSRRMREIAEQVGVKLKHGSKGVQEWQTSEGGKVIATGVGGPITGKGAKLLIIDDPLKNREEAESTVIRQKIWDWFTSTALTRVEPGGSVIVCHCIAQDQPILMADGSWKKIQDIKPGEFVGAYEENKFVKRKVLASKLSGVDPVFEIKTRTKSTIANDRHPFLLANGSWQKVKDLKVNDELTVLNQGYGDQNIDPEFAWFFGFLMGDGWITSWKRKNYDRKRDKHYESNSWCVCFAAGVDEELNQRAIEACTKFYGKPKLTKFGYYRLDSNESGRALQALGLTGGAHGKRIPEWVYRLKPEYKIAYLRGYADADGTELPRSKDSWRVSSVSSDLINDTRLLCISAGVQHGKLSSFKLRVKAPHSHEAKDYECFTLSYNFDKKPERYEKITEINSLPETPVYDLTIAGAENFISAGFIVHNTRWHDDDLIGRIKREFAGNESVNWIHLSMPAVTETLERITVNGEEIEKTHRRALWPSRWNLNELDKKRQLVGEYDWSALYQCEPRPKGGRLFQAATRYQHANIAEGKEPCKIIIGADPAATERTNADYSAIVVASFTGSWDKEDPSNTENLGFRGDILEVWRGQVTVPEFVKRLRDIAVKWGAPIAVEAVAGFKAVPQMLRQLDRSLKIIEAPVVGDKFTRSLPVSAAWNYGRIRIPDDVGNNTWIHDFLAEIEKFTGVKDKHDDQVDALAHAYNAAQTLMPTLVKRPQIPRISGLPFG